MPSAQPHECGWDGCAVLLDDRRRRWCNDHKEQGKIRARTEANAAYNERRSGLAAAALAARAGGNGALVLPRPAAERLAATGAALAEAVDEYDRCARALVGFNELTAHYEGWAELKAEHETRLRFAVTGLRRAALEAADHLAATTSPPDA